MDKPIVKSLQPPNASTEMRTSESGIVLHLADGTIQAANVAAQKILGLTLEQIQGWSSSGSPWQAIHKDGSPFPGETHPAMVTLRTGKPCADVVMGLYKPNGELIWLLINTQPLFDADRQAPYAVIATFTDITEQRSPKAYIKNGTSSDRTSSPVAHQSSIAQEEDTYFFVNSIDLLAIAGFDGYFKRINPAFTQTFGYTLEEMLTKPFLEFVHPEDRAATLAEMAKLDTGAPTLNFENRYLAKDGSYKWVSWRAIPQIDRGVIYAVARDVTKQKQMEASLLETQTRLSLVNSIAKELRSAFSVDLVITKTLQKLSECFPQFRVAYSTIDEQGYLAIAHTIEPSGMPSLQGLKGDLTVAPEYLHGLRNSSVVIVDDISSDRRLSALAEAIQSGGTQAFLDVPLRRSDRLIGLLCFDSPVPHQWSEHELQTLQEVGNYLEVSLQNALTQQALQKSEERWQLAWRGSNDGVWDWNVQTNEVFFSPRWKTMLGFTEDEIADHLDEWAKRVHPDDLGWVTQAIQDHFAKKTPFYVTEHRVLCKDGTYKWILNRGQAVWDEAGNVLRMVGAHTDVTERRELESALKAAKAELEQRVAERTAELQQANAALAEREVLYRMLAKHIPNGAVFLFDRDLRYLLVEGSEVAKVGWNREAMLGKSLWELFEPEICEELAPLYRQAFTDQASVHEIAYRNQIYEMYVIPIPNEQGEICMGMVLSHNLTKRKQAEIALQESQQQLQAIINQSEAVIYLKDLQGRYLLVNSQYENIFQLTNSQIQGKTDSEIFPQERADTLWASDRQVMEKKAAIKIEEVVPLADGLHTYLAVKFPLFNADGNPYAVCSIATNITERKQAEEALRQSEEFKQRMLVSSKDCIKVLDLNGQLLYMNPGGLCLMEIDDINRFLNADWLAFWQGEERKKAEVALAAAKAGEVGELQGFCPTAAGTPKWWDVVVTPIRDSSGQVVQILSISRDVTTQQMAVRELKQKEAALRDALQRLTFHFENSPLAVIEWDGEFRVTRWSKEAENIFGWQAAEAIGKQLSELRFVFEEDLPKVASIINRMAEGIEQRNFVYNRNYTKDGAIVHCEWYNSALLDESGKMVSVLSLVQDVTEWVQLEAERDRLLQQEQTARSAAEAANRSKDEFLAVLSHELRTPLNPILGWAKMLQTRRFSEEQTRQALATIERNAKLQVQLVDDLLDISRMIQGKLSLNMAPVKLIETINAALETVRLSAEAKSIRIETILDSTVGLVMGDTGRLQQVVWNFLTNAIKFTPSGGQVTVRLERVNREAQIQVSDTGKGIHPDFIPHVFELFRQQDSSITRKFGGLGLGLAISRQLVEAHGGTIAVDSAGVGQGATFTVRLPLMAAPNRISASAALENQPLNLQLQDVRVLVVDDDTDSLELIALLLQEEGAIVTSFSSASDALQALGRAHFDILISDIAMPEMDGYTLLTQARSLPVEQNRDIPAIALTAYAGEVNERQALAVGFQRHFAKPLEPCQLLSVLVELAK